MNSKKSADKKKKVSLKQTLKQEGGKDMGLRIAEEMKNLAESISGMMKEFHLQNEQRFEEKHQRENDVRAKRDEFRTMLEELHQHNQKMAREVRDEMRSIKDEMKRAREAWNHALAKTA